MGNVKRTRARDKPAGARKQAGREDICNIRCLKGFDEAVYIRTDTAPDFSDGASHQMLWPTV